MMPVARFLPFLVSGALAAGCADTHPSGPRSALSFDRSTAPGLDLACSDKPGEHLARRPNAPVALLCALTLPAGSKPILNGTKSWADGGRHYLTELGNASVYIWDAVSHDYVGSVGGFVSTFSGSPPVLNGTRSGPNSITFSGDGHAWVSDGNSAVRVVDL